MIRNARRNPGYRQAPLTSRPLGVSGPSNSTANR
jgi:hypothetical protein